MLSKLFGTRKPVSVEIQSPLSGAIMAMTELPYEALNVLTRYGGVAILPDYGQIVAPFVGFVAKINRTGNTIVVGHESGLRLHIRIGIGTDDLHGGEFLSYVQPGDTFRAGDTLIDFNLDKIIASGFSPVTTITLENIEPSMQIAYTDMNGSISSGHEIILRAKMHD